MEVEGVEGERAQGSPLFLRQQRAPLSLSFAASSLPSLSSLLEEEREEGETQLKPNNTPSPYVR